MRHLINYFYTDVQCCILYMFHSHMSITLCLLITPSHEINSHARGQLSQDQLSRGQGSRGQQLATGHDVNSHEITSRQNHLTTSVARHITHSPHI